ncbi:MAG: hypothetical protein Q8O14_05010 [bacterium]|jgi:hypothetical protein|nr:hypothetical protein [bacterium]
MMRIATTSGTLALLAGLLWAGAASAEWLGLGVMLGEPTGLSAKTWLDKTRALDFGLAWTLSDDQDLHLHADYLLHNRTLLAQSGVPGGLTFYYGVGGRLQLRDDDDGRGRDNDDDKDRLGLRIPLGIAWTPPATPLDVFLEVVPVVDIIPDTEAGFNGALGVRFWFK